MATPGDTTRRGFLARMAALGAVLAAPRAGQGSATAAQDMPAMRTAPAPQTAPEPLAAGRGDEAAHAGAGAGLLTGLSC